MCEKIETILNRWTNINEILLRTGEMTAQERRTVLAVTNAMAREIRRVMTDRISDHKQLAQNILHRFLEDGILGETNGKFEMLVEKTLLEELDKFNISLRG
ncbi:hypothetical protein LCGC14_1880080 [marine sediment metagenome]|uniref:Uncharacterized protein n=1 Tax=marine sediment metagenome TaxID=412755 RepID=A0A0F9GQQ7_9ZZZZ